MNLLLIGAEPVVNFDLCGKGAPIIQLVGYVMLGFKIVIPLILLVLGSFELGKAIVAQKDDEIKAATSKLVKKLIVGIIIFFIPTLIGLIFNLVSGFNEKPVQDEYKKCKSCITAPYDNTCKGYVSDSYK